MNATRISPYMVNKFSDEGDMLYVHAKVNPFLGEFYRNLPLEVQG